MRYMYEIAEYFNKSRKIQKSFPYFVNSMNRQRHCMLQKECYVSQIFAEYLWE